MMCAVVGTQQYKISFVCEENILERICVKKFAKSELVIYYKFVMTINKSNSNNLPDDSKVI